MRSTISAILATSIILARDSEGDSRNVRRRFFDVTTVNGPWGEVRVCLVYRRIRDLIRVVFPTCAHTIVSCLFFFSSFDDKTTYPRRSNHRHNHWRRLFRQTIDERHMETLFLDLDTQHGGVSNRIYNESQRQNHGENPIHHAIAPPACSISLDSKLQKPSYSVL